MDLITQAVFGATTFAVVRGRGVATKEVFLGAAMGALPDMDVLTMPFLGPVEALLEHRTWSHSVFVAAALAAILTFWRAKRSPNQPNLLRWGAATFAALHTHAWLDMLTTFGTQTLYPVWDERIAWDVVHVFHPAATLCLLLPWLLEWRRGTQRWFRTGQWSTLAGVVVLMWAMGAKSLATQRLASDLALTEGPDVVLRVVPTPFNSWLWHGVVSTPDSMGFATTHVGKQEEVVWHWVTQNKEGVARTQALPQVQRFKLYTGKECLVRRDLSANSTQLYAVKYGPTNYQGPPRFVFPLVVQDGEQEGSFAGDEHFTGPWSNAPELWERLW